METNGTAGGGSVGARVAASLQRSPYVWLAATILLFVVMLRPLAVITADRSTDNNVIAIGAAVLTGLVALVAGVVLPRVGYDRLSNELGSGAVAIVRWAYGVSVFLVGWVAVLAGGQSWALGVAFVVSAALLIQAARSMAATAE